MLTMNENHQYFWDDLPIVGTNELFKSLGLINTEFFSEEGAARGKRRHEMLEAHDKGDLDWASVLVEDSIHLLGWREFLESEGFVVKAIELPVFHQVFHVAGTLDRVLSRDGEDWVVDIKCSASSYPWHRLQTQVYKLAYEHMFGQIIAGTGTIYLREGKKRNYRWVPDTCSHTEDDALAVILAYHWQRGNKGIIEAIHAMRQDWVDDLAEELDESVESAG